MGAVIHTRPLVASIRNSGYCKLSFAFVFGKTFLEGIYNVESNSSDKGNRRNSFVFLGAAIAHYAIGKGLQNDFSSYRGNLRYPLYRGNRLMLEFIPLSPINAFDYSFWRFAKQASGQRKELRLESTDGKVIGYGHYMLDFMPYIIAHYPNRYFVWDASAKMIIWRSWTRYANQI